MVCVGQQNYDVHLVGGNTFYGLVEVYYDYQWNSVAYAFNYDTANVLCKGAKFVYPWSYGLAESYKSVMH